MSKKVIVILYPGCIFFEIALAVELLAEKYEILYSTPDGSYHHASNGSVIRAETSYKEIDLEDCVAVLIPGGNPDSIQDDEDVDKVLQNAVQENILLAAICAGPVLLAKAGVLKGKKIAHGYGKKQLDFLKSYFKGVELTNEKFVCDGNFITAKPEAHIDFAVEIAIRLDVVDAAKGNRTKDYYRGIQGQKIRSLALGLISNSKGQYLYHKGHDKVKKENFYRPLGGGIDFSEPGAVALEREIMEELEEKSKVFELVSSFENIFVFDGHKGHEIILLYRAEFTNPAVYKKKQLDIYESGKVISQAVWKSLAEIRSEGALLYPVGLGREIEKLNE